MKARTKEEWIEVYNKKLGMKYVPDEHEITAFHPEHGFLSFIDQAYSEPGIFEVHLMVGDGEWWMRRIKEVMRQTGATKIRYITRRKPEAWARKYGARIAAYIMEADIDDIKIWSDKMEV
jgi:hypothetical protein